MGFMKDMWATSALGRIYLEGRWGPRSLIRSCACVAWMADHAKVEAAEELSRFSFRVRSDSGDNIYVNALAGRPQNCISILYTDDYEMIEEAIGPDDPCLERIVIDPILSDAHLRTYS